MESSSSCRFILCTLLTVFTDESRVVFPHLALCASLSSAPFYVIFFCAWSEKSVPPWGISQIKLGHIIKLAKQNHCSGFLKILHECTCPVHQTITSQNFQ